MLWIHAILLYFFGHSDLQSSIPYLIVGITLSVSAIYLLRMQIGIQPEDWMKRMIPHHSTAITTSELLMKNNKKLDKEKKELAQNIITTQKLEIELMKKYLE